VRRQTGALGADRFLDHLDHDFLAFLENLVNGDFLGSAALVVVVAIFATQQLVPVHGIVLMEEPCLFETDIDERGLQGGEHLLNDTLIYIAQNSSRRDALYDQFRKFAVFHDGDALFVGRLANQDSALTLICH